jgi:uracil-DNA glycosylase
MNIRLEHSWKELLKQEFDKSYFIELTNKVKGEYMNSIVYPAPQNIFKALDTVPVDEVKVVILGQDPYHTPNVADGLAFSSIDGNKVPPSLLNIYKEIMLEYKIDKYDYYTNPNLLRWANQGVLLINSCLTVRQGEPNSHSSFGWSNFTDSIIEELSKTRHNIIFILWGGFARKKASLISNSNNHLILQSAHPSPLSAYNGFFGNNHFIQTNEYLKKLGLKEIDW